LALEIVKDRDTREPFPPDRKVHNRVKAAAFERGLLVYPGGGTIDGHRGDHILLAPPFNVTNAELDVIVDRLALALDAAIGDVQ
jgi:adenosylmethionine-8-amino-7-oxononanoate aminotransferase